MNTERRPRPKTLALSGLVALTLVTALTGCSGTVTAGGQPTVTVSVSAPTTTTSTATTSTSATPSATPSTSSSGFRVAGCDTAKLTGALKNGDGAAGSTYYDLTLQNNGSTPCTLQGWPGTSFVTAAGAQIGAAADFDRATTHETVTLIPGGHAVAQLQVGQALNFPKDKCDPTSATRLRVYPPGSTASLTITPPSTLTACADSASHVLRVGALHASS